VSGFSLLLVPLSGYRIGSDCFVLQRPPEDLPGMVQLCRFKYLFFSLCFNHYQPHFVESNRKNHLLLFFPLDGDGRITVNDATKFFSMSKLSRSELKQVSNSPMFHCYRRIKIQRTKISVLVQRVCVIK